MAPGFGGFQTQSTEPTEIDASTPFVAAADGDLTLLQSSIKKLNLSPNAVDSNGFTLLHAACGYCRIEVINWLLNLNIESTIIDVNARDSDNDTPLHHCDDVDSARILIEKGGADHQLTNNEGKTPLQSKEAELEEEDEDDSDGDEDREKLKQLVVYLKSLSVQPRGQS